MKTMFFSNSWMKKFTKTPVVHFSGSNRTSEKCSPIFPDGIFQMRIRVPFCYNPSLKPDSGLRDRFAAYRLNAISERNFTSPEWYATWVAV